MAWSIKLKLLLGLAVMVAGLPRLSHALSTEANLSVGKPTRDGRLEVFVSSDWGNVRWSVTNILSSDSADDKARKIRQQAPAFDINFGVYHGVTGTIAGGSGNVVRVCTVDRGEEHQRRRQGNIRTILFENDTTGQIYSSNPFFDSRYGGDYPEMVLANSAELKVGKPTQDGGITVTVLIENSVHNMVFIWRTENILATDDADKKARKIRNTAPSSSWYLTEHSSGTIAGGSGDIVRVETDQRIQFRGPLMSRYRIKEFKADHDTTEQKEMTQVIGMNGMGKLQGVLSFAGQSTGTTTDGGPSVVAVLIGQSEVSVSPPPGSSAADIEGLLAIELQERGWPATTRATSALSPYNGIVGDGSLLLVDGVTEQGFAYRITDSGLHIETFATIDLAIGPPGALWWWGKDGKTFLEFDGALLASERVDGPWLELPVTSQQPFEILSILNAQRFYKARVETIRVNSLDAFVSAENRTLNIVGSLNARYRPYSFLLSVPWGSFAFTAETEAFDCTLQIPEFVPEGETLLTLYAQDHLLTFAPAAFVNFQVPQITRK